MASAKTSAWPPSPHQAVPAQPQNAVNNSQRGRQHGTTAKWQQAIRTSWRRPEGRCRSNRGRRRKIGRKPNHQPGARPQARRAAESARPGRPRRPGQIRDRETSKNGAGPEIHRGQRANVEGGASQGGPTRTRGAIPHASMIQWARRGEGSRVGGRRFLRLWVRGGCCVGGTPQGRPANRLAVTAAAQRSKGLSPPEAPAGRRFLWAVPPVRPGPIDFELLGRGGGSAFQHLDLERDRGPGTSSPAHRPTRPIPIRGGRL